MSTIYPDCGGASYARTAVVIVTFNGAGWIRACLDSLREESIDWVIVVDNASTDDTLSIARQANSGVLAIALERNLGFGMANNYGIQRAFDLGAEFVCLINQDLTVERGCVGRLTSAVSTSESLGMVSAMQLTYDGAAIDPIFRRYMPDRFWDDLLLRRTAECYDVDFVPAAAVAISRRALLEIGGFDPLFFMYAEDEDLCFRMRARNWKLAVVPGARVLHWHGLVNVKRSFRWLCNLEYNALISHLKQSHRSIVPAFLSWFRRIGPPKSAAQVLARILAFARCVGLARRIARHKTSIPFAFTPCAGAGPELRSHEFEPRGPHAAA
jgi:GT2 family glycosyltransferase